MTAKFCIFTVYKLNFLKQISYCLTYYRQHISVIMLSILQKDKIRIT